VFFCAPATSATIECVATRAMRRKQECRQQPPPAQSTHTRESSSRLGSPDKQRPNHRSALRFAPNSPRKPVGLSLGRDWKLAVTLGQSGSYE